MLNPLKLLAKVFKSSNQKELGRIQKIVDKINNFEKNISEYSNSDFTKKTTEFIKKINEATVQYYGRYGFDPAKIVPSSKKNPQKMWEQLLIIINEINC